MGRTWGIFSVAFINLFCKLDEELYIGYGPLSATVESEGQEESPTKHVIILVVTVTGRGAYQSYICCPNLLLTNRFKSCFNFVAFPVWMTCDMIPATRGNRFALCQVSDATTSRDVPRCEMVLTNRLGF